MSLVELANIFEAATDSVNGLNGFSFGWASDRVRSQIYTEESLLTKSGVTCHPRIGDVLEADEIIFNHL